MDGLWEPPSDPGYAVELWVLPARIGHAALASLIAPGPPAEDYKHLFLVELTASDRQSLLSPGLFRFLHRWPPGDSGGDNLFSTRHYVPYRWHHVVAQRSGGQMEFYVDGVPTQPISLQSASASEPCRLLLGRLKPIPRLPGRVHSRPFVGLIDELALYNRPLTAEEVSASLRAGDYRRAVVGALNPSSASAPASSEARFSIPGCYANVFLFLQSPGAIPEGGSPCGDPASNGNIRSQSDSPPVQSVAGIDLSICTRSGRMRRRCVPSGMPRLKMSPARPLEPQLRGAKCARG